VATFMQSSLVSKIEKSRLYAQQPERVRITSLTCDVQGDNSHHAVSLGEQGWQCDCLFFADYNTCSHSMAMQRLLGNVLDTASQLTSAVA
jgi:hypothetical protein